MGWKGNKQIVTFNPSPWYRYIFFSSLNGEYGGAQLTALQDSIEASRLSNIEQQKEDGIISYIDAYAKKLRAWASQEAAQEIKFLQLAKKYNVNIADYQIGQKFNYLDFIKDLNSVYTDMITLQNKLETHSQDLHAILQAIDNFQSTKQYSAQEVVDKNTGKKRMERPDEIPFISQNSIKYMHRIGNMTRVREGVQQALKAKGIKLQGNSFNLNNLKDEIRTILLSPVIIDAVQAAINNNIPLNNIKNKLFSMLLSALERQKIIDPNAMIQEIATTISTMSAQDIEESYSNVMKWIERTEQENITLMVQQAEKSGENLANLFEGLSLDVQNTLLNSTNKEEDGVQSAAAQAYKKYKDAIGDNKKNKAQIAAFKGQFSKELRSAILKQISNKKGILRSKKEKFIKTLTKISNSNHSIDASSFIASCINNFSITGYDFAEFRAAIQAEIQKHGISYLGGKIIKLKGDIYISYFLNDAPYEKLIDDQIQTQYDKTIAQIENFGKEFLQAYNKESAGNTNISLAEKAYKDQLKRLAESKKNLLDKALNDADKKKINELFQFLSTSISVKKYEDTTYINEGFHGGSLGGGGKVVEAIPNIVKMLDAGGISLVDANTIIGALLNSFNGSAIGTGHEQALKDYLVAGAAMVLFDDGFANGKQFLDSLDANLRAVAPGALHLLFVNDMYIPQSFILTEICNNLEGLASEIKTAQGQLLNSNRTSIQLHNPISYNTLREANRKFPGENNEAQRWEWVAEQARGSVTINLTFMAGMLDIIDALKAKLDQVDNVF